MGQVEAGVEAEGHDGGGGEGVEPSVLGVGGLGRWTQLVLALVSMKE